MTTLQPKLLKLSVRQSAGEFLKVMILEERGLTQKWLAEEIGCAERKISEICNGKRGVSASFAIELEKVFGISAEFWVTMQAKWDLYNARLKAA
jgi:addiction module HigA family antidote